MKITTNRQSGFSLIEVLVAMVIIATGLLGVGAFQATVLQARTEAKQQNEAVSLAQKQIENLRYIASVWDYDNMVCYTQEDCMEEVAGTTATYTLTWNFTPNERWTKPPYKVVQMQLSWVTPTGNTRRININTILTRREARQTGIASAYGRARLDADAN